MAFSGTVCISGLVSKARRFVGRLGDIFVRQMIHQRDLHD